MEVSGEWRMEEWETDLVNDNFRRSLNQLQSSHIGGFMAPCGQTSETSGRRRCCW